MHVYFSGVGGSGIGPLALIAKQAGYEVSGSDVQAGEYIEYLRKQGIQDIHIGQSAEQISQVHAKNPIDWFVYSSALPKTDPDHPELKFCKDNNIKTSRRDEFICKIISDKGLKMLAVAGTHGKTTTTAMAIWLFKELELPVSYSVGAKLSFGEMGNFDPDAKYFVYEADEYDRNFLSFYPEIAVITGIDWDHPDIYPTREDYYSAFRSFLKQSKQTFIWEADAGKLEAGAADKVHLLNEKDKSIGSQVHLAGEVNRRNAWLVANALAEELDKPILELLEALNRFPGLSRRFEQLAPNIYSDYAHTPPKIRGALQQAHEVAGDNVVVVYEGLHNTRQHFIKEELADLFEGVKQLYIVPSYLAREDPNLELLSPAKLLDLLSNSVKQHAVTAQLNGELKDKIKQHSENGDLVLCLSAGGGGSLDEWLRKEFAN